MIQSINVDKESRRWFFLFPSLVLLWPLFPTILGDLGDRLIFMFEFVVLCYLNKYRYYKLLLNNIAFCCFLYFYLSVSFSISCDLIKGELIYSDVLELLKPIMFYMLFSFTAYSKFDTSQIEFNIIKAIKYVFFILVIYSILEFLFIDYVLPFSFLLYKRESVGVLRNKAIGSFSQTYQYAFILLIPTVWSFIKLLLRTNFKSVIIFFSLLFCLLLTQSRSMYLTVAFSITICLTLPIVYSTKARMIRVLFLIGILFLFLGSIFITYRKELEGIFAYAFQGFASMAEGNNNSVNTREMQIQWAWEHNPFIVIGAGIGKGQIMLESFYGLYYYRFGLIGICIYMLIIMYSAYKAFRIARFMSSSDLDLSCFYYGLYVFFVITPMGILSSCHQDTPKISLIFYGLIGLVHLKYRDLFQKCKIQLI